MQICIGKYNKNFCIDMASQIWCICENIKFEIFAVASLCARGRQKYKNEKKKNSGKNCTEFCNGKLEKKNILRKKKYLKVIHNWI